MESVIWAQSCRSSFAHMQEVCRSHTQLILRVAKAPSICFNEERRPTLVGSYRAKEKPFRLKVTMACRSCKNDGIEMKESHIRILLHLIYRVGRPSICQPTLTVLLLDVFLSIFLLIWLDYNKV